MRTRLMQDLKRSRREMNIDLKGIHIVHSKRRTYYYAWRGGPRLRGAPGSPEFINSYNQAIADRVAPDTTKFKGIVAAYRGSNDFKKLADSTRKNWSSWLDRIGEYFGE